MMLRQPQQQQQPRKNDPLILRRCFAIKVSQSNRSRRTAFYGQRGRFGVSIFVSATLVVSILTGIDRLGRVMVVPDEADNHNYADVRQNAGTYRDGTAVPGLQSIGGENGSGFASLAETIDEATVTDHPRSELEGTSTMNTSSESSGLRHTNHSPAMNLDDTLFLHVGKAGGGTVMERLTSIRGRFGVGVNVTRCHPRPCPGVLNEDTRHSLSSNRNSTSEEGRHFFRTVLVNVRDPVDRFYSAFHWRDLVFCRPGDDRAVARGVGGGGVDLRHAAVDRPDEYCQRITPLEMAELGMIRRKYGSDANALAEALCGSFDGDVDGAAEARRDLKSLAHARDSLADWFGAAVASPPSDGSGGNGTRIAAYASETRRKRRTEHIAVVLEPGYDFVAQVDAAIRWMVDRHATAGGAMTGPARPSESAAAKAAAATNDASNAAAAYRHSHREYLLADGIGTGGDSATKAAMAKVVKRSPLSKLGECCVARHYASDYRLLRDALLAEGDRDGNSACRGEGADECRSALRSILSRRAAFLDLDMDEDDVDGGVGGGETSCRDMYAMRDHA